MKKILLFLFLGIIAVVSIWRTYLLMPVKASAPGGYMATQPSSSQITLLEGQVAQVFASSTNCVSRVISVGGFKNLWIMFGDSATLPSVNVGGLHPASSTVAYDAGLYGCGLWRIHNQSATTAIFSITEFSGFR
ncbi:MAG: hypothetical protein AAB877_01520 [Patescibacteria group bacterium]